MIPPNIAEALRARSTATLVDLLQTLDTLGLSGVRLATRNWIIEEIEERYDVAHAMDRWVMNDHSHLTYVEALIAALPLDYADPVGAVS